MNRHLTKTIEPRAGSRPVERLRVGFLSLYPVVQCGLVALGFALVIFAAVKILSPAMFSDNHGRVVFWPVDAVLVAAMLMVPRRYWPWILLGASVGQIPTNPNEHWIEVLVDLVGNVGEVLIAAYLLPPFRNLGDWMQQPKLVFRFIGGALFLAPAVPATAYGLFYRVFYHHGFLFYASTWACADVLGMALCLPLILVLCSHETYDLFRWRSLGFTVALLGFICALSWCVFHYCPYPVAFVLLPALLLVVFQLGFSGSVIAVNLLTIIVSSATLRGSGPFEMVPEGHEAYRIAILQLFLVMAMLMSLPVSVALLERKRFEAELKDAYHSMELVATLDGLTGISNRRRFDLVLEQEWRRTMREGQSLALLMIDADFFKAYNDFYGHVAGDDCLRRLAEALRSVPSRSGDLLARYGGEEFAILLPDSSIEAALAVAARLRLAVSKMKLEHQLSQYCVLTVSVGCGVIEPRADLSTTLLIERADQALYAAKQRGRNCVETWHSGVEMSSAH